MDQGIVTTLRGQKINMHELRNKAKQPFLPVVDHKDKVQPQKQPPRQPNIHGFMPSMNGVARPQTAQVKPVEIVRAEQKVAEEQPTPADFTGVVINSTRRLKERPADVEAAANDALNEIIGDLEKYKKDVEPIKPRRGAK
jgi:hypothetical protein